MRRIIPKRRVVSRWCLALAGLFLFPQSARAGTIAGYVVDACYGTPINAAAVSVLGGQSTSTNSSGYYTLNVKSSWSATVEASKSLYQSQTQTVRVNLVGTTPLDFALCPNAVSVSPPGATTYSAQNITNTTATVRGYVLTRLCGGTGGARYTAYHFEYGTSTAYGNETPTRTTDSSGTVAETISGLTPNTPYYFRIVASNCGGTKSGSARTFTTLGAPGATTDSAEDVKVTGARVCATINPGGASTTYKFQYGPTTSYGSETSSNNAGSGNADVAVSMNLSGLLPATLYHYRVVASNTYGTAQGEDRTFTTEPVPIYRFHRIWPTLQQPHYFGSGGNLAVDTKGRVYLADTAGHRIMVFSMNGQFITQWGGSGTEPGKFQYPMGIAVDADRDRVYVADRLNSRIQVFTGAGEYITAWGDSGEGEAQFDWSLVNSHIGMAVDEQTGLLYVTDQGNDRVQVFGPSGGFITSWGGSGSSAGLFDKSR